MYELIIIPVSTNVTNINNSKQKLIETIGQARDLIYLAAGTSFYRRGFGQNLEYYSQFHALLNLKVSNICT